VDFKFPVMRLTGTWRGERLSETPCHFCQYSLLDNHTTTLP
jgi:hypothetical protein